MTLSNPSDPTSLTSQTHTVVVNGRTIRISVDSGLLS